MAKSEAYNEIEVLLDNGTQISGFISDQESAKILRFFGVEESPLASDWLKFMGEDTSYEHIFVPTARIVYVKIKER